MQLLRLQKVASLLVRQPIQCFAGEKIFRERDEAAEKVFISRQESMFDVTQRSR
jgi:hypothetical protein